jgi:4-amino-4-deoxy-L-arabinose transferase-like glycosyltransferase
MVAIAYRVFGVGAFAAMVPAVVLGTLGAVATLDAARIAGRWPALACGLLFALHPALLSYTPALMTEGISASLLAIAMALALRAARPSVFAAIAFGLTVGILTYVRPQNVVFAPLLPVLAFVARERSWRSLRRSLGITVVAVAVALAVVLPWTVRNCSTMGRCALVSVNGGWNLLIGTDEEAGGTWAALKVPEPCREVWDEAEKDACFGRAAGEAIAARPGAWLALAPTKLAVTFEYFGAGPWYLHASNPEAFSHGAKQAWGAAELVTQRLLLFAALAAMLERLRPHFLPVRGRAGRLGPRVVALVLAASGTVATLVSGVLAIVCALHPQLRGPDRPRWMVAGAVIVSTAAVHAVFFGAGRYGLVVIPATILLAVPLQVSQRASGF